MKLWIGQTTYCHTLVTFAETEKEAREKLESLLVGTDDSIVTIREQKEEAIYV